MSLLQSVLLGLLQGLTEFLPVSSSGHLAIVKNIFHIEMESGLLFDVLLHLGTLAAIVAVYYRDIWEMLCETVFLLRDLCHNLFVWISGRGRENGYRRLVNSSYRKLILLLLVSAVPTGLIGMALSKLIEQASDILLVPGIGLIVTAVLLFVADHTAAGDKTPKNTSWLNAVWIGASQGVAALPGLSRSGTTITACLLCGFDRKYAVKFSFLMSIPAVLGAAVLECRDAAALSVPTAELGVYAAGILTAALVGYVCIRTMLVLVRQKKFTVFAVYCLLAGMLTTLAGALQMKL